MRAVIRRHAGGPEAVRGSRNSAELLNARPFVSEAPRAAAKSEEPPAPGGKVSVPAPRELLLRHSPCPALPPRPAEDRGAGRFLGALPDLMDIDRFTLRLSLFSGGFY